jgi:hypothetical protein
MSACNLTVKWLESDFQDDASPTVELIRKHLPHFEPKIEFHQEFGWWDLRLPIPDGAEYRFSLHGQLGGERQISATPLVQTGVRPQRFWYSPLELAAFRDDASKLDAVFQERVDGLLQHPTRIFEKKGVIWLSYRAEYRTDAGWKRMGGYMSLGVGLGVPFVGKMRIYTSPPVATREQQ